MKNMNDNTLNSNLILLIHWDTVKEKLSQLTLNSNLILLIRRRWQTHSYPEWALNSNLILLIHCGNIKITADNNL